jgi:hypothetical protein
MLLGDPLSQQTATVLLNSIPLGLHDASVQGYQSQVTFGLGDTLVGYKTMKGSAHRGHSWDRLLGALCTALQYCWPHVQSSEFCCILDTVVWDHKSEFQNTSLVLLSQYKGRCYPTPFQPTTKLAPTGRTSGPTNSLAHQEYNHNKFETLDSIAQELFPGPNCRFLARLGPSVSFCMKLYLHNHGSMSRRKHGHIIMMYKFFNRQKVIFGYCWSWWWEKSGGEKLFVSRTLLPWS